MTVISSPTAAWGQRAPLGYPANPRGGSRRVGTHRTVPPMFPEPTASASGAVGRARTPAVAAASTAAAAGDTKRRDVQDRCRPRAAHRIQRNQFVHSELSREDLAH